MFCLGVIRYALARQGIEEQVLLSVSMEKSYRPWRRDKILTLAPSLLHHGAEIVFEIDLVLWLWRT
jgi:hypothetical protein